MERDLVPRVGGIRYALFPMAPPSSARGLPLLALATLRSILLLLRARPRVAFATGGYISAPAAIASWLLRIPLVLYLPDIVPGKAVAWLAPAAKRIAVSTDDALAHLPRRTVVVTGYPVREAFSLTSRQRGRERFGLAADSTVLCVFGGSQGAQTINDALAACLPEILPSSQVLHVAGPKRWDEARSAAAGLSAQQRARYHLYPYLHEHDMADALAAADLVVCRSGASVLGELPAVGTPAVLVPFPDPAVHQQENADYLAHRGAAVVVPNDELQARLAGVLHDLLGDTARLERMAAACRSLARPEAAAAIARLIEEVGA